MLWFPSGFPETLPPLIKVPLLVSGSVLAQLSTTQPNNHVKDTEQKQKRDWLSQVNVLYPRTREINHVCLLLSNACLNPNN